MTGLPEPPFILVADDDRASLTRLRTALRMAGAQTAAAATVKIAIEALAFHAPTLVVAALGMEDGKGWEILRAARAHGQLPTIALARGGDPSARRAAFAAGADDVLSLPTDADEVAVRAMALAGRVRHRDVTGAVYRHRGLVMDVAEHSLRLHGRPIETTPQQFAILQILLEANGATIDRARILARIQSLDDEPPSERSIDLHVARLRRRLGDVASRPTYIAAVYGIGYRLATDEAAANDLDGDAEDVLASLPDPLLVIDKQLRVRFANDAATRLLALPRAQIVGRRCGEVLGCRDRQGPSLDGPRCFALAITGETAILRDMPANVRTGDDREDVTVTYARVAGDGLLSIGIRPATRGA